jgi:PAS domain S-box-containing protein
VTLARDDGAALRGLTEASTHWSATFDAMNDLVCLLDTAGTVLRCNRSMTELLGLETDQVVGRRCYDLMHHGHTFFERCPYVEMLRTGRRESFELALGDRWYQVTADPLRLDGEIVGAVHIVRDITDRRLTDEALAERSRWLVAVNALAVDLAALPGDARLGPFLAARLLKLTGGAAVAFSEYDPDSRVLVTTAIEFQKGSVKTLTSPLVRRLRKTRSPVSDKVYAEILRVGHATRGSLTEVSFGAIPPAVDATVRRLLGVDRFVGVPYVVEGALFGTSVIALRTGAPGPPREELEAFANLAAVSLRRRRAEMDLRRASAYNRSLIEASLDPLVTIGPDGLITDVNATTVGATGRTREELVGTDFADCFTEPDRARAGFERVFQEGAVLAYPLEMRHRTGAVTEVLCNATTYRHADGRVAGVFVAARDVGELNRAEEEIRALNAGLERRVEDRTRELAATSRDLQELVYSVAHDLRTPLRAVDGFSLAVLEDYGDVIAEAGRADLQRVRAAAQTMGDLIDALLSLSRVGRREVGLGEVDLSAVARRVIAERRDAEPDRVVDVTVEDGLVAESDPTLVAVVLENLLGNAWKFTAERREAHIAFGSLATDGERTYFVRDDGAGFDQAYVHKLFTPFQRLHTAEQFPGTGIGLATVGRVLERLGGTFWAEGAVGCGATFFFTLGDGAKTGSDPRD